MFGLFKASDPPTFGDTIWKLILRIVAGLCLIGIAPFIIMIVIALVARIIELPFRLLGGG